MEMRPGGIARSAGERHPLSGLHGLALLYQKLAAMGIKGGQSPRMPQLEVLAIDLALPNIVHRPVRKRQHIRSAVHPQIHAVVKLLASIHRVFPPAEIRGDPPQCRGDRLGHPEYL